MMPRDEFSLAVKRVLAQRAGYRCSFPECKATTIGPSHESALSIANTGEAAHISAASPGKGARRYNPNLTHKQRISIDNGLWCCRTHAKQIDCDEVTYTVEMLRKWRELAEKKAELRQITQIEDFVGRSELLDIGLAKDSINISDLSAIHIEIGTLIECACISDIYGVHIARSIREFLIEYALNAFMHGHAKYINLSVEHNAVTVTDDGKRYDISRISMTPKLGGGGKAYRALLKQLKLSLIKSKSNNPTGNKLIIPIVINPHNLAKVNPCAISLSHEGLRDNNYDFRIVDNCDIVYLIAPLFLSFSDILFCKLIVKNIVNSGKQAILILQDVSEELMLQYREELDDIEVIGWND